MLILFVTAFLSYFITIYCFLILQPARQDATLSALSDGRLVLFGGSVSAAEAESGLRTAAPVSSISGDVWILFPPPVDAVGSAPVSSLRGYHWSLAITLTPVGAAAAAAPRKGHSATTWLREGDESVVIFGGSHSGVAHNDVQLLAFARESSDERKLRWSVPHVRGDPGLCFWTIVTRFPPSLD